MAPLTERLRFERRKDYLYASLECVELTPDVALDALSDILGKAATERCKKIMVKCNVASFESDTMLLESMLALASMNSGSRIAFVECKTSGHEHPALGPDFKLFDDERTAEEWLSRS